MDNNFENVNEEAQEMEAQEMEAQEMEAKEMRKWSCHNVMLRIFNFYNNLFLIDPMI